MIELCEGEDTDEVYDIFYTQPYKRYTVQVLCLPTIGKGCGRIEYDIWWIILPHDFRSLNHIQNVEQSLRADSHSNARKGPRWTELCFLNDNNKWRRRSKSPCNSPQGIKQDTLCSCRLVFIVLSSSSVCKLSSSMTDTILLAYPLVGLMYLIQAETLHAL